MLSAHGPSNSLVNPSESTAQARISTGMEGWRDSEMLKILCRLTSLLCCVVFMDPTLSKLKQDLKLTDSKECFEHRRFQKVQVVTSVIQGWTGQIFWSKEEADGYGWKIRREESLSNWGSCVAWSTNAQIAHLTPALKKTNRVREPDAGH